MRKRAVCLIMLSMIFLHAFPCMAEISTGNKVIPAHEIMEQLKKQAQPPPEGTRGVGTIVPLSFGEGLIPFDYNKYNIKDAAKPQLDEIGKALQSIFAGSSIAAVEIAGHTDRRGSDEYNQKLSVRRAQTVVDYLVVNFNIPRDKLVPQGYGKSQLICTSGDNEACHSTNRRVAIKALSTAAQESVSPGVSMQTEEIHNRNLTMGVGFFHQKEGSSAVEVIQDGKTSLRSQSDKYFFFLKPGQDCYAYILQEDSRGKTDVLFPRGGASALVRKDNNYWIPSFGGGFKLDDTKGEEKLYLIVTPSPRDEIVKISGGEQLRGLVRGFRMIKVVRPAPVYETVSSDDLNKKPQKIDAFLEQAEGKGGWVKIVRFNHQ